MSFWVPQASKMDTMSDLADIAKTYDNLWYLMVLEGWRLTLEAWRSSWLSSWLADGLVAAGWLAGRPRGPQDPVLVVRGG